MKKLIRGLKDVSPFFISDSIKEEVKSVPEIEKSVLVPIDRPVLEQKKDVNSMVSCFAVLPEKNFPEFLLDQRLISKLRKVYNELYILTSMSQKIGETKNLFTQEIEELTLTSFQAEDLLHPEPVYWSERNLHLDGKRQCFFLDPKLLVSHPHLFQMLDRIILHVSAVSPESIARAYQMLTACLQENSHTRFFLYISQASSEEALEIVYERFTAITSRFLGCEVDFLGFSNDSEVEINEEILRGNRAFDEILKDPIKARLKQLFSNSSLEMTG